MKKTGTVDDLLADYELRYRLLAANVTLGMFRLAPGTGNSLHSANHSLARMLGYDSPEELAGKPLEDLLFVPRDGEALATVLRETGACSGQELLMKRRDGSQLWVSVQAWNLGTKGSPVSLVEGFVEDITEHKVFEQEVQYHESELNRFTQDLSHANKKLHILSTITRHDILNKLTGLQGYHDLMKMEYTDPKIQEYLAVQETIIDTISRQIRFTREYQDVGIESPAWFDVRETVERAAAGLPLRNIRFTVSLDKLQVYADPMFEKVFYNLFENALRHAEHMTRLSCTAEISPDGARIIVEDDGIGVPEEAKEAIFVRKHYKNTGFGLYLAREILGITGLGISENGKPGHSARFEITVPPEKFRTGDIPP